jgi:integrase
VPRGAAVIRYEGKRGPVWRIKYRDAAGKQVMETLGPEPTWTERRAQRELGKRLDAVDKGFRKPTRVTFAEFAGRFEADYLPGRNLKRSTLVNYRGDLRRHLLPYFGTTTLAELAARPELIDAYIADKTAAGLSPKSIANHLTELSVMFKVARRWGLVDGNPIGVVDRPRLETPEMNVLTESEVARLLTAYDELAGAADENERRWWLLAKRLTTTALATAMRRGELLALRWQDVKLLEGLLTVRQSLVRGQLTSPKSRASRRTIELGPRALAVLAEQWEATYFRGDDDFVFCHPQLGAALDPSRLSRRYLRPALKRAGIEKPFRPWHDMRHTALTHEAAAGNPQAYVQLKAGHSQGTITERYIHAAQVLFPGAAARGEMRLFGSIEDAAAPG